MWKIQEPDSSSFSECPGKKKAKMGIKSQQQGKGRISLMPSSKEKKREKKKNVNINEAFPRLLTET